MARETVQLRQDCSTQIMGHSLEHKSHADRCGTSDCSVDTVERKFERKPEHLLSTVSIRKSRQARRELDDGIACWRAAVDTVTIPNRTNDSQHGHDTRDTKPWHVPAALEHSSRCTPPCSKATAFERQCFQHRPRICSCPQPFTRTYKWHSSHRLGRANAWDFGT